ncbi:hypothetical protein GCM10010387_60560 [Streptomyces inusitatus]|uniref:HTH merR-type domain-containing protein n=1 Tax=Streptomyces inusitatus TaxID=68221 RepID=A0A918QQ21_9ACTN|nr:MerR family transcriptional regulator [Streptomyces inusitatus]GGZ58557.1 hypothetical protein GCM10010387_60560 [Streptomyces inusitatus]
MRNNVTRPTPQGGWSIGELAAHSRLPVKTVRYYTDIKLLPEVGRSPGGHRRYGPDALERLCLIRRLRSLGQPIATITQVLSEEVSLSELASAEQGRAEDLLFELRWRRATWQALYESAGDEQLRRLEMLARVQRPPQAHAELIRAWKRSLPRSLPGRLIDLIVSYAAPAPPRRPSPRKVLAYGELHALAARPDLRAMSESDWYWQQVAVVTAETAE